jgi:hypothetical protein
VKVNPVWLQTQVRSDAVGNIVDEQVTDTVKMSDSASNGFKQFVEAPGTDKVCRKESGLDLPKDGNRDPALVRMPLASG